MPKKRPSKWLGAIESVLSQSDQPMTAEEIARKAMARQLVDPNSLSPADSVRVLIQRHIERDGNQLAFVVGGSAKLRLYWLSNHTPWAPNERQLDWSHFRAHRQPAPSALAAMRRIAAQSAVTIVAVPLARKLTERTEWHQRTSKASSEAEEKAANTPASPVPAESGVDRPAIDARRV